MSLNGNQYGSAEKRKSKNLLLILGILVVLIAVVFLALYLLGQRFGVPV